LQPQPKCCSHCKSPWMLMWMSPSSTRRPPSTPTWTCRSRCRCTVLLPCGRSHAVTAQMLFTLRVYVSVDDPSSTRRPPSSRSWTCRSCCRCTVLFPCSRTLAAAARMLSTLRVYVSVINKTATLLSFMDLPGLSIVGPRSRSRSRSLTAAAQLRLLRFTLCDLI
jgi:hypothetical protein